MDEGISAVLRSGIFTIITACLTCLPWLTVDTVVGYVLGVIVGAVCIVLFVLIKRLIRQHRNKISFRSLHYDENNGLTVCTMKGNDTLKVAGAQVGNNIDLVSIRYLKIE